jgi:hypothetical protein
LIVQRHEEEEKSQEREEHLAENQELFDLIPGAAGVLKKSSKRLEELFNSPLQCVS